jgi:hypothetical protein
MFGFLLYVALCATLTLGGVALLALLRLRVGREMRLLLAPCAMLAVWACIVGLAVALGLPVRRVAAPVWLGTALLTIGGAVVLLRKPAARRGATATPADSNTDISVDADITINTDTATDGVAATLLLPALCAAAPLLTLAPYLGAGLLEGYRGSGVPDGWSYVAFGQYLWEQTQGVEGGLSLLHQYGSNLSHMRYVASAELGLLSWLIRPGDTQQGAGLLQSLSIWALLTSCAAFARSRQNTRTLTAAYVLLIALSGWTANVIWASNYDNGLALTWFPALVTLALGLPRSGLTSAGPTASELTASGSGLPASLLAALLSAATIYTYPEFSVVLLGCAGAVFVTQAWCDRQLAARLRAFLVIVPLVAVVVGPYWPDYVAYLQYQTTVRPGLATFHGLVEPRFMSSAYWSLGGEHRAPMFVAAQNVAGVLLLGVLAAGAFRLARRGAWPLLVLLGLLLGGTAIVIFRLQYSYGAYKVILIGWWFIVYTLVMAVTPSAANGRARLLRWAAAGLILAIPGATLVRNVLLVPRKLPPPMAAYRVLEEAVPIVGDRRVAILVDDPDAIQWAVYFFRQVHARLGDFALYLAAPNLRARVERAEPIAWPAARLVLTDAVDRGPVFEQHEWTPLWRGGAYALWDTQGRSWAMVTDVASPGDAEETFARGAPPPFKIGATPTRVTVVASVSGLLELSAPIDPAWGLMGARLVVDCAGQTSQIALDASAPLTIPLALSGGETACTLRLEAGAAQGSSSSSSPPLPLRLPEIVLTHVDARWTERPRRVE